MTPARILIVGAGPTGLVLALWLARSGVRARVIDRADGPGEASRAIAVQARVLEFYRQLGFADEVVAGGIQVEELALRAGGHAVFRAPLGNFGRGMSPYPFVLSFPQDDHERLLLKHLERAGVTVERRTELTGLTQRADRVVATLKTPTGSETVEAEYVCGCDGAHSAVRRGLGVGFPGGRYDQVFFVADTDATGEMAAGSLNPCLSPDGFTLVIPVRSTGRVRLIGIVPEAHQAQEHIAWDDVAPAAIRTTGLTVAKVHWYSTYRIHHRVANAFRVGRAFLAGDAGHIHSPAGGQGMNTGIGDAVNLAWKLAAVAQGRAASVLLDTYEPERIAFARRLIATTDWLFQLIAARSWLGWVFRGMVLPRVLPLAFRVPAVQWFAFRTVSQILIDYRPSRLSSGAAGRVRGGDRLPWIPLPGGDNFEPLNSLDWQVHVHGSAGAELRSAVARTGVPLHAFGWSDAAAAAGLARDAAYLVRPDGHVAHAGPQADAARFARVLTEWGVTPRPAAS